MTFACNSTRLVIKMKFEVKFSLGMNVLCCSVFACGACSVPSEGRLADVHSHMLLLDVSTNLILQIPIVILMNTRGLFTTRLCVQILHVQ